jgi:hypothetical protein
MDSFVLDALLMSIVIASAGDLSASIVAPR